MSDETPKTFNRGILGRRGGAASASGKSQRLPTMRTPRDLTLGGVQKKTFAPNIPARRKQEDVKLDKNEPKKKEERKSSSERGGRGRGRGRGRGEVIQSHSIFEQGPTEKIIKPSWSSGGGADHGGRASTSAGPKKVSIKKERAESRETKEILDDLLRDDFLADDHLTAEDPSLIPIKLPLSIKSEIKVEKAVKQSKHSKDDESKMEIETDVPAVADEVDIKPDDKKPLKVEQASSPANLFHMQTKSETGQLIFVQLPDTLPGEPQSAEESHPSKEKTDQSKTDTEKLTDKLGRVNLDDFNEGHIGKLQVLQSGRTRLILGDNILDVSMGTPAGFLQDLVSIHIEDNKTGDMTMLGHVNHKLVCVPDMDLLLESL